MNPLKKTFLMVFFSLIGMAVMAQVAVTANQASPLPIGSPLPKVNLQNMEEKTVASTDAIKGPAVLVVYRGGWCPYCNKQLSGLGKIEEDILALGYKIIAISPDAPAQLKETLDKQKLSYTLLSDSKAELIKAMGLAFAAPEKYGSMLLKASGGGNTGAVLPVPAVYVLDKNQKVTYVYTDPDYSKRLDEQELLKVLKGQQGK